MERYDLQETAGNVAWANDNKTLFYVTKDKLDRPFKVSVASLQNQRHWSWYSNSMSQFTVISQISNYTGLLQLRAAHLHRHLRPLHMYFSAQHAMYLHYKTVVHLFC